MTIGTSYSTVPPRISKEEKAWMQGVASWMNWARENRVPQEAILRKLDESGVKPEERGLFGIAPPAPDERVGGLAGEIARVPLRVGQMAGTLTGAVAGGAAAMMPGGMSPLQGMAMGAQAGNQFFQPALDMTKPPESGMGRVAESAAVGGIMGGVGRVPGMISGAMSLAGGQAAQNAGLGPLGQGIAEIGAGILPVGGAALLGHTTTKDAERAFTNPLRRQVERPGMDDPASILRRTADLARQNPDKSGLELMTSSGLNEVLLPAGRAAKAGGVSGERVFQQAAQVDRSLNRALLSEVGQVTQKARGGALFVERLKAAKGRILKPLYESLENLQVKTTDDLAKLYDMPAFQRIYEKSAKAEESGVHLDPNNPLWFEPKSVPSIYKTVRVLDKKTGKYKDVLQMTDELPLGVLDRVKRIIDDVVAKGTYEANNMTQAEAREIGSTLEALRNHLDLQYPQYGTTRELASKWIMRQQAVEQGQKLRSMTPDEISVLLKSYPDAEQPVARALMVSGHMEELDILARAGHVESAYKELENSFDILRPLMPPDKIRQIESLFAKTAKQRESMDIVGQVYKAGRQVEQHSRWLRVAVQTGLGLLRSSARDALTEILQAQAFGPRNAAFAADVLGAKGDDLAKMLEQMAQRSGRVDWGKQALTGAANAMAGSALAPRQMEQ